ncbi:MAG: hypothetical protein ABIG30_03895 [Candidatus Aenigmatarchaeota archaeon]
MHAPYLIVGIIIALVVLALLIFLAGGLPGAAEGIINLFRG